MRRVSRFDIFSLGIISLISFFSAARFDYLPQFIDGYYHLSVANAFIASGGWIGWAWWEFAPMGRPHLYPPLYHFILVFLKSAGLSGLNSVRITEVAIVPLFFFSIWYVLRKLINDRFSFFSLLTLSSFFSFYSSVSGNIPASLSIIFGFLTWLFIKKKKIITATLFLILSFYTHAGVPWMFLLSLLFLALSNREYRRLSLKIILTTLTFASPLLYHQVRHISYLNLKILGEVKFTHFSIFIILLGVMGLFLHFRKKEFPLPLFLGLFWGGLAVFIKHSYRLFSAQGMVSLTLLSSLVLEKITSMLKCKKLRLLFLIVTVSYLFFSHATFDLDEGKLKFNLFNSTYSNFLTGRIHRNCGFRSFFYPQYYYPLIEVIGKNTKPEDIISSNLRISSQIFAALTNRPSEKSGFGEVEPKNKFPDYAQAKLVIWLKSPGGEEIIGQTGVWKQIYENDFAHCFLNLNYKPSLKILKAKISFKILSFIFLLAALTGYSCRIFYRAWYNKKL
ncbi:MAG: hypothetical protein KKC11_09320 [Candidatus Omnitrophica bacterium]|nr:hypothetical protein [Candidatus Omnitrophota bacterium]MBU1133695.1 hypothetical protein [Candidatus Omnitrophota bacterium]MBU1366999.1 hypothetical protein [Candidatus Omnitrophota bacterium]MBU1523067.1 hypothetical protein [Candidatus Omnitrophota bacterium]MBU1810326.1 hypothetical protein [Candidatus Omnitrophota bacterium]